MKHRDKPESYGTGDLPVTKEVGSEGGSYSDAAVQKTTRDGELPHAEDTEAPKGRPGEVAEAIPPPPDDPEDGVHRQA